MLKTQKIYLPVSVKERTPDRDMWINVLTKASNLPQECWYYKKLFYKDATYQKKHYYVTHWLEEKEMIVLTQEQAKELIRESIRDGVKIWNNSSGGNTVSASAINDYINQLFTDK